MVWGPTQSSSPAGHGGHVWSRLVLRGSLFFLAFSGERPVGCGPMKWCTLRPQPWVDGRRDEGKKNFVDLKWPLMFGPLLDMSSSPRRWISASLGRRHGRAAGQGVFAYRHQGVTPGKHAVVRQSVRWTDGPVA